MSSKPFKLHFGDTPAIFENPAPLVEKIIQISSGTLSYSTKIVSESDPIFSFIGKTYNMITREDKERLFTIPNGFAVVDSRLDPNASNSSSSNVCPQENPEKSDGDSKGKEKDVPDSRGTDKRKDDPTLLVETLHVWQGWELVEETSLCTKEKLKDTSLEISVSPKFVSPAVDVSLGVKISKSSQTTY
jgi:hypothetical protein